MHYKATDNSLYFLSDEEIANGWESSLPMGCERITDEQAQAIREQAKLSNRAQTIAARLASIDAESIRPARAVAAALAAGSAAPSFDTAKLQALETEAQALRQELAGLQ